MSTPIVPIDHGGLENGRNVVRCLCGARPNGQDLFVWYDPEDPYRTDYADEEPRRARRPVPESVTCPRCLRIAQEVLRGIVLDYAVRETLALWARGQLAQAAQEPFVDPFADD